MTTYSLPRREVSEYTIYPTGFDQSPFSDTSRFCVQVRRFSDTGKWYVTYSDYLQLSHKGKWIDKYDRKNVTQWCRFDTAEDAIELAEKYVDSLPGYRNLVAAIEFDKLKSQGIN